MAVVLYTAGTSEVVNGVPCRSMRIEYTSMTSYLEKGWVLDPRELIAKPEPVPRPKPARERAKEAGHPRWNTDSITSIREWLRGNES